MTPAPLGDKLLTRAGKLARSVRQRAIHVAVANDGATDLQTLVEKVLVKRLELRFAHCGIVERR
jgi:hypothetical protein